jgi:two-component system response regulator HydG
MSNAPHRDQILIIEDEEIIRISLRKLLERHDYDVSDAVSIKAASDSFDFNDFALIISDLRLPGQLGTDLIKMVDPVPVLIMTSYASLRSAVDTMRQGAVDYISKPFDHDEMLLSVRRILSASQHRAVAAKTLGDIALLGSSEAIKKVTRMIPKVAASDLPILIQGETGSGKSAVALAIHKGKKSTRQRFININCAGLKEAELVSQLDASNPSATIFLNNIAELAAPLQPLLLRAMQTSQCRFIGSSDQDLEKLCQANLFRKDLYYEIDVVSITMPTLRQRNTDIPIIAQAILKHFNDASSGLTQEAIQALVNYQWPGNLRQLKNTLQQAVILASPEEPINAELLGFGAAPSNPSQIPRHSSTGSVNQSTAQNYDAPAGLSLEDYFTRFVLENQENMSETDLAKKLGISRKSLWERRHKLGISRKKGDEPNSD